MVIWPMSSNSTSSEASAGYSKNRERTSLGLMEAATSVLTREAEHVATEACAIIDSVAPLERRSLGLMWRWGRPSTAKTQVQKARWALTQRQIQQQQRANSFVTTDNR